MTHPNLLRVTRWCAKWASGVLLVATLFGIGPFVQGSFAFPGRSEPGPASTGGGPIPLGVTDLQARALSDSAVVLTWTEVRNVGSSAIPRYVLRYDSLGAFTFGQEPDVATGGCAAPIVGANATGGRPHACMLAGLLPNRTYQFQMVSYIGVLNSTAVFGPLSNIAEATTMERLGAMILSRPRMFRAPFETRAIRVPGVGDWRWPLPVQWAYGDYQVSFLDSAGVTVGIGYLLIIHP